MKHLKFIIAVMLILSVSLFALSACNNNKGDDDVNIDIAPKENVTYTEKANDYVGDMITSIAEVIGDQPEGAQKQEIVDEAISLLKKSGVSETKLKNLSEAFSDAAEDYIALAEDEETTENDIIRFALNLYKKCSSIIGADTAGYIAYNAVYLQVEKTLERIYDEYREYGDIENFEDFEEVYNEFIANLGDDDYPYSYESDYYQAKEMSNYLDSLKDLGEKDFALMAKIFVLLLDATANSMTDANIDIISKMYAEQDLTAAELVAFYKMLGGMLNDLNLSKENAKILFEAMMDSNELSEAMSKQEIAALADKFAEDFNILKKFLVNILNNITTDDANVMLAEIDYESDTVDTDLAKYSVLQYKIMTRGYNSLSAAEKDKLVATLNEGADEFNAALNEMYDQEFTRTKSFADMFAAMSELAAFNYNSIDANVVNEKEETLMGIISEIMPL